MSSVQQGVIFTIKTMILYLTKFNYNRLVCFHLPHSGHADQNGDTYSLTTIDSNSRNKLADFIEELPHKTCDYTCLGEGLEQGLNVKKIALA